VTHNEVQAAADRIAQALPGHLVEVIMEEEVGPLGPCHPSVTVPAIRIDRFYLLSHVDPLGGVARIFGVEVQP
jgi:hypothetical protein